MAFPTRPFDKRLKQCTITGKTCLVTGANSGIGYATTLELAKRGAGRIIMACRNVEAGEKAAGEIRKQIQSSNKDNNEGSSSGNSHHPSSAKKTELELVVRHVDLASLTSVRRFAEEILATEKTLDVLVNNAGMLQKDKLVQLSEDGFEITFATNFLGPFLLTNLLLDLIKKSAPARIINVTSQAYQAAWPEGYALDDVNQADYMRRHDGVFSYWRAYSQSKLALILFTRALHRRLAQSGGKNKTVRPDVSVFTLHPGEIRTNVTRYHPSKFNFIRMYLTLFGKSVSAGGEVPAFCACEPDIEKYSGKYFSRNCKTESVFAFAKDDAMADSLYEQALEWCGLAVSVPQ